MARLAPLILDRHTPTVRSRFVCRPEWEFFAGPDWQDRILELQLGDRYHAKQGRSIARWTLTAGRRRLVVYLKRHYRLPRWQGYLSRLFPGKTFSPGMQEWHNLNWAAAQGIPVPRPWAAGEWVGPSGRLQSFLAVEELTGMLPLHEAIPLAATRLSTESFSAWKAGLACEMARLVAKLHRLSIFHKDLYLCHFYLLQAWTERIPDQWQGRLYLIDFHRLGRHRITSPWWQVKDLAQLQYSTTTLPVTAKDVDVFWKVYLEHRSLSSPSVGLMARSIRWKCDRYLKHNRKRLRGLPAKE